MWEKEEVGKERPTKITEYKFPDKKIRLGIA